MSNSISLAKQYLPIMDEIFKRESLTSVLEGANGNTIRFVGGNKAEVFKSTVDGFGDYSRNNGFVTGSQTATWEELTMDKDRGISLTVDAMDNEETLGMAFGTLVGDFMRTKEIPEIDSYRFSKLAGWTGITSANADVTVGTTDIPGLIDTAEETMCDDEVPLEGRLLFVSEKCYHGLKAKITRTLANENGVNTQVETFNGMRVIRVPKGRFNTAITLNDGSESFGYSVTAGGYPINFMIVHPSAVVCVKKHEVPRIWTPEQNLNADAWKFDLRVYHTLQVLDNKKKGIYLHRASTANT